MSIAPHATAATPRPCPPIDAMAASDAACTLVELSTVPGDRSLLQRAAEQLPALVQQVRGATGATDTEDDADWLTPWRSYGIVRERTV